MEIKDKYIKSFRELGQKYGFPVINLENNEVLIAKNISGEYVDWITYDPILDTISLLGNTDICNIWLCHTRKDFTPEKTIQFIEDLNKIFELKGEDEIKPSELIDPEDWQQIANVNDAYKDTRYYKN